MAGVLLYDRLETDFLPKQDEGGFVLDYFSRPGTSLSEINRMREHVQRIIGETPEVESYSRRTGARLALALALAEPNFGDFLVKLRPDRRRTTTEVVDELRQKINEAEPALHTTFAGVLGDLITDLTYSPSPVEIKLFSTDTKLLKQKAPEVAKAIESLPGVVDVNDGVVVAGPSMRFRVLPEAAARVGLTARDVGVQLQTALLGQASSYLLQGDRTYGVRVLGQPTAYPRQSLIATTPIRSPAGPSVTVGEVSEIMHAPGILERRRDDLRQLVAVSARLSGIDLGRGIAGIQEKLAQTVALPASVRLEYGGLYQQQEESSLLSNHSRRGPRRPRRLPISYRCSSPKWLATVVPS